MQMKNESQKVASRIPFSKALFYIFISIVFICGTAGAGLIHLKKIKKKQSLDPQFNIVAIAQKCTERESLKTVYLAELMGLSIDRKENIYEFNLKEAESRLLTSSLIQGARLQKIKPGIIYVDYDMRTPVAFLGDFSNTAIDSSGVLIPFKPFFTPKRLPVIILGVSDLNDAYLSDNDKKGTWGHAIDGPKAKLALNIFKYLTAFCCNEQMQLQFQLQLQRLDVSKAYALSYGRREIVVILENKIEREGGNHICQYFLRLSADNFPQELANFLALYKNYLCSKTSETKPMVIDLRLSRLAYLSSS
jgi:hypothetical protein